MEELYSLDALDQLDKFSKELQQQAKDNPLAFFVPNKGAQEDFWSFTAQEQCFSGGNRSGKSEGGGAKTSKFAIENPGRTIWCATEDFDTSKGVQQAKIDKFIPMDMRQYGAYTPQNGFTNGILVLTNGTKLLFKSYQQGATAFMGDEIDLIWLDEPPPWAIYVECLMRTLTTKGKIFFTFTEWQDGVTAIVDRVIINAVKNGVQTAIGSTYENTYIDPKDIERIESILLPHEREARIMGRPVQAAGRVYHLYEDKYHFKPTFKVPDRFIIFEGIDPHNEKPSHWLCCGLDPDNGKLWLIDEYKSKSIASEFAREILERRKPLYKNGKRQFTIIDHSAKAKNMVTKTSIFGELYRAGLKDLRATTDAIKKLNIGINAVLEVMKVDKEGNSDFGCMDRCSGFRNDILKHVWDKHPNTRASEKKDPKNKPITKFDDYLDILRYIIMAGAMKYAQIANTNFSNMHTDYVNNSTYEDDGYSDLVEDPRIALENEVNGEYVNWLE